MADGDEFKTYSLLSEIPLLRAEASSHEIITCTDPSVAGISFPFTLRKHIDNSNDFAWWGYHSKMIYVDLKIVVEECAIFNDTTQIESMQIYLFNNVYTKLLWHPFIKWLFLKGHFLNFDFNFLCCHNMAFSMYSFRSRELYSWSLFITKNMNFDFLYHIRFWYAMFWRRT